MPLPEMTPVQSSNVKALGYDPETRELHVEWHSGKVSIYGGVAPGTAEAAMSAPSVGGYVSRVIRGQHEHRYRE